MELSVVHPPHEYIEVTRLHSLDVSWGWKIIVDWVGRTVRIHWDGLGICRLGVKEGL